ncbi:MAG: hypothetical protein WAK41_22340 [Roseiarcus sp.]|uniref:hypothetical protein n=1 Tax=Roseiarcus sp. TaxID=1969460 RepID=UPI003BAE21D4
MSASRSRVRSLWFAAAAAIVVSAGLTALGAAGARGDEPAVSPDRIDDAPMTAGDSFSVVGNFAWRAFVALNWPSQSEANERGVPDRAKSLGDPGKRVWETFKSDHELFEVGDDGRRVAPSPWASYDGRNPCGVDSRMKTIATFAPFADFNQPSFAVGEPANPLVAQNGAYTRYEIHFNEPEFSTLAASGWSQGRNLPDETHPAHFPVGSIAVKAAWRPLSEADTPAVRARYYVESAEIVDVAKTLAAGRIVCTKAEVALVGLHIVIKTKSRAQWVWSTFEHVDNVPPAGAGEPDAKDAGAPYSYFDPSKPKKLWPPLGTANTMPVDWTNPPRLDPARMQVVRRYPIHAGTMALNRAYWALPGVKGTVWEHYMLVAAQWPTSAAPPGPDNDGAFFPGGKDVSKAAEESYRSTAKAQENLVNTTMETYLQDLPSSCIACHQALSNARGRDFVGILASVR